MKKFITSALLVLALAVPVGFSAAQEAGAHGAYHHHNCNSHIRRQEAVDLWYDPSGHSVHSSNIGTYWNWARWKNELWEYHEHWYASSGGWARTHTNEKVRYCGDWR